MEYYICKTDDELYHWGIKGMKWGIRRYQNKDGSLTPAGKKRVAAEKNELKERERSIKTREKEKAERAKLNAKKNELDARERELNGGKKTNTTPDTLQRTKSISEMSNKELQEYTTRMQLEKNYYDAQKQLAAAMPPKQISAGQKFANKMINDVIMPAATNAGKQYLEKMIKEKAGIKDDVKINWDDIIKKQTYEKNEKNKAYEDLKRANDIADEQRRKAKAEKKAAEEAAEESKSKNKAKAKEDQDRVKSDYYNNSDNSSTNQYEGTYRNSTGYSRSDSSVKPNKWSSKNNTIIDAEWYESNSSTTSSGQSYVTALLEAPDRWDDD